MCFQSLFEWAALLHPFLTQPIGKLEPTTTAAQLFMKAYDEKPSSFAILRAFTLMQAWPLIIHRNVFLL